MFCWRGPVILLMLQQAHLSGRELLIGNRFYALRGAGPILKPKRISYERTKVGPEVNRGEDTKRNLKHASTARDPWPSAPSGSVRCR